VSRETLGSVGERIGSHWLASVEFSAVVKHVQLHGVWHYQRRMAKQDEGLEDLGLGPKAMRSVLKKQTRRGHVDVDR
jgi:hypothetical protein